VLPAAGWLAGAFGRKRLLITCVSIFTLASLWAGAATSLPMIVIARVLQGLGGGALQPLAQAVLLESFPPEKRGAAMAVYGMGVVLYGSIALLPLFLQTVMDYPPLQSGLALSPRGVGALASMVVVGRLVARMDTRYMIAAGFTILALATYMLSHLTLDVAMRNITVPNVVAGFALGFIFVPLTTTAMGTLRNEQIGGATGLFNLMRNIGGSVGIAVVTTLLARTSQRDHALLVGNLSPDNPVYQDVYRALRGALAPDVGAAAGDQANAILYQLLLRQVALLSYVENFRLIAVVCLACVPLVFLFRRVRASRGPIAAH